MPQIHVTDKINVKWYLRPLTILLAAAAVGPLAIPLVWMSPAFKKWQKMAYTTAIVLLTAWVVKVSIDVYEMLLKEMRYLQDVLR